MNDWSERYSRQTALPEVGASGQGVLTRSRVLVVGVGGLGCPAATYLCAAGVGHLTLLDPDTVQLSNLQRQPLHHTADVGTPKALSAQRKLAALNPDCHIHPLVETLTPGNADDLMAAADLTLDCTDSFGPKLLVSDTSRRLRRPCVVAGVKGWHGQLLTQTPDGPTYRDLFGEPTDRDEPGPLPVIGVTPATLGALQAAEALKLLLGKARPALVDIDLLTLTMQTWPLD